MIDRIGAAKPLGATAANMKNQQKSAADKPAFGDLLRSQAAQVNFSKHALSRVEERGIELTPDLMDKLADSVEKAQEKGAVNILAFGAEQAFIINVPHSRVITTITQDELKEKVFTNIDAAVLL